VSQNKIKNDQTQNKNHFIQLKHDLFETKEKILRSFSTQKMTNYVQENSLR
jgi:hypothetical protein